MSCWSSEPGVDELDAGLHPRPGPVVGDGSDDATEPQRPLKVEAGTGEGTVRNKAARKGRKGREVERKRAGSDLGFGKGRTDGAKLVLDDPLPGGLQRSLLLRHDALSSRNPNPSCDLLQATRRDGGEEGAEGKGDLQYTVVGGQLV